MYKRNAFVATTRKSLDPCTGKPGIGFGAVRESRADRGTRERKLWKGKKRKKKKKKEKENNNLKETRIASINSSFSRLIYSCMESNQLNSSRNILGRSK